MTLFDPETLPPSWAMSSVGEIAAVNPRLGKSDLDDDIEVSFVPMSAVEAKTGSIDVAETRKFREVNKGYTAFRENDVLFAKITPCMENGKMAIVPAVKSGLAFGSTEFHVIRAHSGISPKYLYYFVSSQQFRYDAEHNMSGAVGQRRVPAPYLAEHPIPVPPSALQRRIVAKIEEMFSELDKGVESLTSAREQLKVYRQVVLQQAADGNLLVARGHRKSPFGDAEASKLRDVVAELDQGWSPRCLKSAVSLREDMGGH